MWRTESEIRPAVRDLLRRFEGDACEETILPKSSRVLRVASRIRPQGPHTLVKTIDPLIPPENRVMIRPHHIPSETTMLENRLRQAKRFLRHKSSGRLTPEWTLFGTRNRDYIELYRKMLAKTQP